MDKKSGFTFIRKNALLIGGLALVMLMLSGCQANMEPIDAETAGVFNHYVIYPFSFTIKFMAGIFGGSYGLSLLFMTVLLRFALMPLMMKQYKSQLDMKGKMAVIQPEMDELKHKFDGKKAPEDRQKFQQEMMSLYKKHDFNPVASMGCLPMLIQFPILIGFYYAIMRTPEIAEHNFLWFNLGSSDLILPFVAMAVYMIQFKVSQTGAPAAQQKQMAVIGYLMPLMMGFISFNVAAALPLYWSAGGVFLIFQSLLFKWLYRDRQPALKPAVETK